MKTPHFRMMELTPRSKPSEIAERGRLACTSGMSCMIVRAQDSRSLDFKKPQDTDVHMPRGCSKRRRRVTDGQANLEGWRQQQQVERGTQLLACGPRQCNESRSASILNIVNEEEREVLTAIGAEYVVNSSLPCFKKGSLHSRESYSSFRRVQGLWVLSR